MHGSGDGGGLDKHTIDFEETELRLGLGVPGKKPGCCGNGGKRVFSESIDLKLNLTSAPQEDRSKVGKCMANGGEKMDDKSGGGGGRDPVKPPAKAQVVGWPPVRSFRKSVTAVQPNKSEYAGAAFVKVSMDGAPYLRKVDLKLYKSYRELSVALAKMFSSFAIGDCGYGGTKDFMNEGTPIDLVSGSEYVPAYEDKDGDWMLVGDVPWEMFVDSCKRLRITKGSDGIGLEKCKNRSC